MPHARTPHSEAGPAIYGRRRLSGGDSSVPRHVRAQCNRIPARAAYRRRRIVHADDDDDGPAAAAGSFSDALPRRRVRRRTASEESSVRRVVRSPPLCGRVRFTPPRDTVVRRDDDAKERSFINKRRRTSSNYYTRTPMQSFNVHITSSRLFFFFLHFNIMIFFAARVPFRPSLSDVF